MLKYTIALIALTFSFQASALDAATSPNIEPPKSSLTMVPDVPATPPPVSGGGGGGGSYGGGGGDIGRPKPIETLPPVSEVPIVKIPETPRPVVDQPIAKVPEPPVSPVRPIEPPIVKTPEPVLPRPIVEPPFYSSCGYIKNRLNVRYNSAQTFQALMSLRNQDYDMLRHAQNKIYDLTLKAQRTTDASLKASLQTEISCFRDVAQAAEANVNADSQAISKLLNSPIVERPIGRLPPEPQPGTRLPASTAPAVQQVRAAN